VDRLIQRVAPEDTGSRGGKDHVKADSFRETTRQPEGRFGVSVSQNGSTIAISEPQVQRSAATDGRRRSSITMCTGGGEGPIVPREWWRGLLFCHAVTDVS
jgi:hypothetical protein